MKNKNLILSIVAALVLSSCAHETKESAEPVHQHQGFSVNDVSDAMTWGASDNVRQLKYLYFSSQPDQAALEQAKNNGVTTVINLRNPTEHEWDEKGAAESLGMTYINLPIPKKNDSFDPDTLMQIEQAVKAQNGTPVLLHCSTGNRAAAWLAIHMVEKHHTSRDLAIDIARKAGLTHEGMESRVRTYLSTH